MLKLQRNVRQAAYYAARADGIASIQHTIENFQNLSDPVAWVTQNRWIDGAPWSFSSMGPRIEYGEHDVQSEVLHRPYLLPYLRDAAPEKSVIKNRQSEFTENSINEGLYYVLTRPHTRLSHVFPTDDLGDMVSNEKIAPAIRESPRIRLQLQQGAVRSYRFQNGGLYTITGAMKKTGGRAGSRDIVLYDEYDFIPESIVGVYDELMSHSALRYRRFVSTPTVPGIGISKRVKEGCEYDWIVKCPACNKEQIFEWPGSIIGFFDLLDLPRESPKYEHQLHKAFIGCLKCGRYLNRNSEHYVTRSQWIAQKPHLAQTKASYQVTGFMIPWKTGKELLRSYHDLSAYPSQFMNEKLGLAHIKGNNRLTEHEMAACQRPWGMVQERIGSLTNVAVGIDWGEKSSWVVISASGADSSRPGQRSVVFVEEINDQTLAANGFARTDTTQHVVRACQIIDHWHPDIIITDGNGLGMDRATEIVNRYPRRAWAAFFDTAEMGRQLRQSKLIKPTWAEGSRKVTFSKLNTLKELMNDYRRQVVGFPKMIDAAAEVLRKFVQHHMGLGIQPRWSVEMDREYEIVVKFGEDHLLDSDFYSKIGWDHLTGHGAQNSPGVILKRT